MWRERLHAHAVVAEADDAAALEGDAGDGGVGHVDEGVAVAAVMLRVLPRCPGKAPTLRWTRLCPYWLIAPLAGPWAKTTPGLGAGVAASDVERNVGRELAEEGDEAKLGKAQVSGAQTRMSTPAASN